MSHQRFASAKCKLDGILGGYSLHILQPLPGRGGGGVFWVRSDLDSGKKVRVFHFRGGVFWVSSDLNSGKKEFFIFWGGGCVLGKLRFELRKES